MEGTPDTIEVPDPSDPEAAFAWVVALRHDDPRRERLEHATTSCGQALRTGSNSGSRELIWTLTMPTHSAPSSLDTSQTRSPKA